MSLEIEEIPLQQQFEEAMAIPDKTSIREFLNNLNISDVANLIYENSDTETQIISLLEIHRAASVFKILDLGEQKTIIKNLPPYKSAE
jgi:magnesium transporter